MKKIGILGKMASGKTTLANYILNLDEEFTICSFGDQVKTIAKDLFNMKEKDRKLLQQIGAKMREIDPDVWINYVLNKIKNKEKVIIDDVRYENEIIELKKLGFNIIYLEVSDIEQIKRLKQKYPHQDHTLFLEHESEKAENYSGYADTIISGDVNDLEYKKMVEKILLR